MSSGKIRRINFIPVDWLMDEKLKSVSHSTKGMWIDLLCLMSISDVYGCLIFDGKNWNENDIKKHFNYSEENFNTIWSELFGNEIIRFDEDKKYYYSKRLVNDYKLSKIRSISGSLRTNNKTKTKTEEHIIKTFVKKNCPNIISNIENQLTNEQCRILNEKYPSSDIRKAIFELENTPKLGTKYNSVYLTLVKKLQLTILKNTKK